MKTRTYREVSVSALDLDISTTTEGLLVLVLAHAVHIGGGNKTVRALRALAKIVRVASLRRWLGAVEDIRVLRGEALEDAGVDTKVLRQNLQRSVN